MRRFLRRSGNGWDTARGLGPLANRLRRLSPLDRKEEARAFLEDHARATGASRGAFQRRWSEVRRALDASGHYDHTPEELSFGAKLAWRNHARCIGRLFWDSLELRDRRHLTTPEEIFADLCDHLATATAGGRIRSMISVYPPARPGHVPCHVESSQLVGYAGYLQRDGRVLGDRKALEATRIARTLGWEPPAESGRFDLLPVMLRDARGGRHIRALPEGLVLEVSIRHPHHPGLGDLGLRWYAVPVVSDMILTVGGIDYPCAPFNGFYMCTEIASRNLADRGRYDLLPEVARAIGLEPSATDPFWRDAALTELNRAVLSSYRAAGVTMVDDHSASDQFVRFCGREAAAGRIVSADWAWIVPPHTSGASEVFHLEMKDLRHVPNFYRNRAGDGRNLGPMPSPREPTLAERWLRPDRLRRAWRLRHG